MKRAIAGAILAGIWLATPAPSRAASTAYRMADLDLRDPHIYIDALGCRDVTDTQFLGFSYNGELQTNIQTDSDSNGFLDLNLLIVFDPLDQGLPGNAARFVQSTCTPPLATATCGAGGGDLAVPMTLTNQPAGNCLGVLAGTTRPYTPAITSTVAGPCFSSDELTLTLELLGVPLTLRSAQVAATYVGVPASQLVNGLLRGFLSEADANSTIVPASYPLIGGRPFSSLLPGGDPPGSGNTNCAGHSDKDLGPDGVTLGWWMYFNFRAVPVTYLGPQVGVPGAPSRALALAAWPSPFRSNVALECWLEQPGPARLAVYDLLGRKVAELANGSLEAGPHRFAWDGRTANNVAAAPGLYVVRLSSRGQSVSQRIMRLR